MCVTPRRSHASPSVGITIHSLRLLRFRGTSTRLALRLVARLGQNSHGHDTDDGYGLRKLDRTGKTRYTDRSTICEAVDRSPTKRLCSSARLRLSQTRLQERPAPKPVVRTVGVARRWDYCLVVLGPCDSVVTRHSNTFMRGVGIPCKEMGRSEFSRSVVIAPEETRKTFSTSNSPREA